MIKFSEFLTEGFDAFHNRSVGIISASRGNLSPEVNDHRTAMLHADLKARGHKITPVKGGFIENHGTPEAHEVHEKSFLVMHNKTGNDNGVIHKSLTQLGKKYNQDSILHKPHNSDVASFHTTTGPKMGAIDPIGKKRAYSGGPYFTEMPNGKRFTFGD